MHHKKFVSIFIICLHIKFHILSCNSYLVVTMKWKAEYNTHEAAILHLSKYSLVKMFIIFKVLQHKILEPYMKWKYCSHLSRSHNCNGRCLQWHNIHKFHKTYPVLQKFLRHTHSHWHDSISLAFLLH